MRVALLAAVLAAAPAAVPKAGTYVRDGGSGTLVLGKGRFSFDVLGANAHLCQFEGAWKGEAGVVDEGGYRCEVKFVPRGDALEVSPVDPEPCRAFCGARAYFDGTYLTPPKGCARGEVAKTRAAFKALYVKKQWAAAVATLRPVVASCFAVVDRFERAWVLNALALAQHHAGDDAGCLATLEPLSAYRDADPDAPGGREPAFEQEFERLVRATSTNAKLCGYAAPPK